MINMLELKLWLKEQPELSCELDFYVNNINCIWSNNKTKDWMIIEDEHNIRELQPNQREVFDIINRYCSNDPRFHGVHVLAFKRLKPDDIKIFWDGEQISKARLLKILMFEDEDISSCMQC